jgi:hypothetical protein
MVGVWGDPWGGYWGNSWASTGSTLRAVGAVLGASARAFAFLLWRRRRRNR